MPAKLEFWFDFASTYSYLTAMRIEQAASAQNVTVVWQPFLLGPIFADQGWTTSPFSLYPAKGRYMWRDMERLCNDRNLPFVRPDTFPQNSLKAARLALAVAPDHRANFVRAVYSAEFEAGDDISDETVLAGCLKSAGSPDVLDRIATPEIKSQLFDQVSRAKSHGIFGAPSFIVKDELFWGDDRLDSAIDFAAKL